MWERTRMLLQLMLRTRQLMTWLKSLIPQRLLTPVMRAYLKGAELDIAESRGCCKLCRAMLARWRRLAMSSTTATHATCAQHRATPPS